MNIKKKDFKRCRGTLYQGYDGILISHLSGKLRKMIVRPFFLGLMRMSLTPQCANGMHRKMPGGEYL